jgi:hypothetical protein
MSLKSKVQSPKSRGGARVEGRGSRKKPHTRLGFTFHETRNTLHAAFTLIEVMIALGIFFMAVFTILALVSQILRNARGLQRPPIDAGLAAAIYVNTNRFGVGNVSGNLGESLHDFTYEIATDEFATNGLLQADVLLTRRGSKQAPDAISILVFDPNQQSTPFSGRR